METVLFWIAWGIISSLVLKTFYFSYSKDKLQRLRLTAFGINFSVLVLFFLPWISEPQGVLTGLGLILESNPFVTLLGGLIVISALSFLSKDKTLLKAGAVSHLSASVLFILTMMRLMPGTVTLTLELIAPIVATMILLVGNVVVLLLWQQLQLKKIKKTARKGSVAVLPILLVCLLVLGLLAFFKLSGGQKSESEKETFALPLKSGVVCAGLGNFSFQMDSRSSPIAESDRALILQSASGLLLVTKKEIKIDEILKEQNVPFEKTGDSYVFSLSSETPVSAMSSKKGEYTISLLHDSSAKEKAQRTFQTVVNSIKGGCDQ
ncbi:hypothetical protein A2872_02385 [Candidatus Gottesmanbacteria bacterium RIFCSPHIGHO2_01_FULL_42_12]|uniref:Uncharacterized protein n=1 Tax=Candidatus Gottesmanbacteria bacterium RIFCSPHIGHO2_01_FULL_42_12 TaxID=1798377 RepID=A0A1F5Z4S3_9BACT|nr:MAG: hypothetical protein A2872_02385 [Candidatus Gottesmanbacteria bacterium RIFCSPHIGHO2_01_FULL_42_12]